MTFRTFKISLDYQHYFALFGLPILTAGVAYLTVQDPAKLFAALLSFDWSQEKPYVYGVLFAMFTMLIGLIKKSIIVPIDPPPSAGAVNDGRAVGIGKSTIIPAPPLRMTRLAFMFASAATLSFMALVTGCTAAQWASFKSAATQFIDYVQTFLQTASIAWALIQPLLGAAAPAANAAYQAALLGCTTALGVMQDALKTGDALSQQPTNLAALIAPVQDACQKLVALINQYRGSTGAQLGETQSTLDVQAQKIWSWK